MRLLARCNNNPRGGVRALENSDASWLQVMIIISARMQVSWGTALALVHADVATHLRCHWKLRGCV
eukprot:2997358-Alexandrium_andersonii.AAC.1